ncbi:hypothetical protein EV128_12249 [Rhizobium azibense]|nr:hypothetical protein EV128_12249 [Rhizobium azibense]
MEVIGRTEFGEIIVTINGATMTVPDTMANRHRREIAEWEAAGNTIPPYQPPLSLDAYKVAFDAHLDTVAQARQYDNRLTIATYITSSNPQWSAEAEAFISWRDQALTSMFTQLAAVQAGATPPTVEEFIAALPVIVWP